jgi:hypothetical protein
MNNHVATQVQKSLRRETPAARSAKSRRRSFDEPRSWRPAPAHQVNGTVVHTHTRKMRLFPLPHIPTFSSFSSHLTFFCYLGHTAIPTVLTTFAHSHSTSPEGGSGRSATIGPGNVPGGGGGESPLERGLLAARIAARKRASPRGTSGGIGVEDSLLPSRGTSNVYYTKLWRCCNEVEYVTLLSK